MNLPPYVFKVDHVPKIRSQLSITVLEKKTTKLPLKKVTLDYLIRCEFCSQLGIVFFDAEKILNLRENFVCVCLKLKIGSDEDTFFIEILEPVVQVHSVVGPSHETSWLFV